MRLLATVGGETCTVPGGTNTVHCPTLLGNQEFWLEVVAAGVSSVASPWEEVAAFLLPALGIRWISLIGKKKIPDPGV